MRMTLAAADIGSNTVHLLVASTDGKSIKRINNESEWLSLGEVVSRNGLIPRSAEDRLISTLRRYSQTVQSANCHHFYVFATEAMRLASNHDLIIKRIERTMGISVDLITPIREAELSVAGCALDSSGADPMLLVEVGGGSAQVAWCMNGKVERSASLPLGTGRLIADSNLTTPAGVEQLEVLRNHIRATIENAVGKWPPVARIVGCGGVARGLVRALHADGDPTIDLKELEFLGWSAARLPLETLMIRFGVKEKRAMTLLPGASVFENVLRIFSIDEFHVSSFGVREGAILELFHQENQ